MKNQTIRAYLILIALIALALTIFKARIEVRPRMPQMVVIPLRK